MAKKYDFSGYATKVDLTCADGRVIRKDAFKHNDGQKVPLVWQHMHDSPDNILGHALLENREDGVYAYCSFNDTISGKRSKVLVEHGDIVALSIHANQLKQKGNAVLHGMIREVSLVLAGANPGAFIDDIGLEHSDSDVPSDDVLISMDLGITTDEIEHGAGSEKTVKDVFDSMNEEQKEVVYAMLAQALGEGEDDGEDDEANHSADGGNEMKHNAFEKNGREDSKGASKNTLTHEERSEFFQAVIETAKKTGSLREAVMEHAVDYGIENIEVLFPDAQALTRDPQWLKREDGWVSTVLGGINKSPFSRIKSIFADMDFDAARAKGYIKATEKKEVYFKAAKRVTTPTTVYVKQKLDRDDIIDVTDFDIVAMVRFQLRTLLDEELALAAILGDGRAVDNPDKIPEENIRPIWTEEDLYVVKELLTSKTDYKAMIKQIAFSHKNYKGSGSPIFLTTADLHSQFLWVEDDNGRRIYESDATLCAALRVSAIVEMPPMEDKTRVVNAKTRDLLGIKVNLKDYNFGADKGGQVASFDDFDIDFNQYKYLMETRVSGAMTKAYAAQVYEYERP